MIELESVSRTYDQGRVVAIDGLSTRIESGEKLGLRGPSGAGKSTLLNLIGGIEKPSSGSIRVDGRCLTDPASLHDYRADSVGFVFQFHHLLPHLTAIENVEIPLLGRGMPGRERRRRAFGLLESAGVSNLRDRLPERLSGGERQRVAVARALVNDPAIILADEPTGSLDTESGERVLSLLLDYCECNRATLIVATHNPNIAGRMSRVLPLSFGRIDRSSLG